MVEWIEAILINAVIVYACWKFTTFGLSGGFDRFKKKKKSSGNSGAKFG